MVFEFCVFRFQDDTAHEKAICSQRARSKYMIVGLAVHYEEWSAHVSIIWRPLHQSPSKKFFVPVQC